jgi:hypothetical protein
MPIPPQDTIHAHSAVSVWANRLVLWHKLRLQGRGGQGPGESLVDLVNLAEWDKIAVSTRLWRAGKGPYRTELEICRRCHVFDACHSESIAYLDALVRDTRLLLERKSPEEPIDEDRLERFDTRIHPELDACRDRTIYY